MNAKNAWFAGFITAPGARTSKIVRTVVRVYARIARITLLNAKDVKSCAAKNAQMNLKCVTNLKNAGSPPVKTAWVSTSMSLKRKWFAMDLKILQLNMFGFCIGAGFNITTPRFKLRYKDEKMYRCLSIVVYLMSFQAALTLPLWIE